MNTPTVYVLCDANCKWESLTREQILTAITQAVSTGTISDIDTGFVQTIKTINGTPLKFFVGEQAEYNALSEEDKQNLFAIITNDTTKDGITAAIEELQTRYNEMLDFADKLLTGEIVVEKSGSADAAMAIYTFTESADLELPVIAAEVTNNQVRRMVRTGATYNPTTDTLKITNIETVNGLKVLNGVLGSDTEYGASTELVEMPSGKTVSDIVLVNVKDMTTGIVMNGGCVDGVAFVSGCESGLNAITNETMKLTFTETDGTLFATVESRGETTIGASGVTHNHYNNKDYTTTDKIFLIYAFFE